LLLIVLLSFQTALNAQCDQVIVSGKVLDTLREQNFFNLMVINKSTGRGVFGQPNGHFSVYARPGDRIALSTKGYPVYEFIAKPVDRGELYRILRKCIPAEGSGASGRFQCV
jgi:hypothetical protein